MTEFDSSHLCSLPLLHDKNGNEDNEGWKNNICNSEEEGGENNRGVALDKHN